MTTINDKILMRGSHAELRIVVFEKVSEDSSIGVELTGCNKCTVTALAIAMLDNNHLMQMIGSALGMALRKKAEGKGGTALTLHDKVNSNLN